MVEVEVEVEVEVVVEVEVGVVMPAKQPEYEMVSASERFRGIGGGTIAAVLGLDARKGPIDVYNEQVDILEGRARVEDEPTPRSPKWWGIKQEPIIVEAWSIEHPGYVVMHAPIDTVRSTTHPFWRATPDALVYDHARAESMAALTITNRDKERAAEAPLREADRVRRNRRCRMEAIRAIPPDILLECKAHRGAIRFQYGDEDSDEVPDDKRAQVYWTGGLLGIAVAEVPVLFDTNQPRWFRVPVDASILADMLEHVRRFMDHHVAKRIPPPADGSPSFERHIRARFGADDGTEVLATDAVAGDVAEMRELKAAIAQAESQLAVRSQRVREHMAAASTLRGADGRVLATWRRNARGNVLHKEVAAEFAVRLGMTDVEREAAEDAHRAEAPRVLLLKK